MNKKKIVLTFGLILAISVGALSTWAYLNQTTEVKKNIFKVGQIDAELTEPNWDPEANIITPNKTLAKDPTVTVKADSEPTAVYIAVENQLVIEGVSKATYQVDSALWEKIDTKTVNGAIRDYYKLKSTVATSAADQSFTLFNTLTIAADTTAAQLNALSTKTMNIVAYVHQVDNVDASVDINAAAITAMDSKLN